MSHQYLEDKIKKLEEQHAALTKSQLALQDSYLRTLENLKEFSENIVKYYNKTVSKAPEG